MILRLELLAQPLLIWLAFYQQINVDGAGTLHVKFAEHQNSGNEWNINLFSGNYLMSKCTIGIGEQHCELPFSIPESLKLMLQSPNQGKKYVKLNLKSLTTIQKCIRKDEKRRCTNFLVSLSCSQHFYGADCDQYCKVDGTDILKYYCDAETGIQNCLPGLMGEGCNKRAYSPFLAPAEARDFLNVNPIRRRVKRWNTHFFEETIQGNIERECEEESCNWEEAREVFEWNTHDLHIWWNTKHDRDDCKPRPCSSGAYRCDDLYKDFKCYCKAGWRGKTCSENINDCVNKCLHGGQCTDFVNDYKCTCKAGFTGRNCQIDIDDCATNPCKNGAICNDHVNSWSCTCRPGFVGRRCEENVNECQKYVVDCKHGGSCSDLINGYQCNCLPGFSGRHCEIDIDDCIPDPCRNGICVDAINGFSCNCLSGYEGKLCDVDINECAPRPCKNGATCVDDISRFLCFCRPGYSGLTCAVDINDCEYNPCQNGGVCNDLVNDFSCNCTSDWTGKTCSHNIDVCVSSPCKNNGFCTDLGHGYKCSCVQGFTGKDCEVNIDECAPKPCKNGAHCVDRVDGYQCACIHGSHGTDCENLHDYCVGAPCKNNATCALKLGGYECFCEVGYTGDNCDINIDDCVHRPCLHGGICVDAVNDYICKCPPGYTGKICSINIDECDANPCLNNGICEDLLNDFSCRCKPGFTGKRCETDINECQGFPCRNGATCVNQENEFKCECVAGFTGILCETNPDDCDPDPCQNGGKCNDRVNGFKCDCKPGYGGVTCKDIIDKCVTAPCKMMSNCTDVGDDYKCVCVAGYTGKNCDINIDDCIGNPCKNGGICEDLLDAFSCECAEGYTGTNCEKPVDHCLVIHNVNGESMITPNHICGSHGDCKSTSKGSVCVCHEGFTGNFCNLATTLKYKQKAEQQTHKKHNDSLPGIFVSTGIACLLIIIIACVLTFFIIRYKRKNRILKDQMDSDIDRVRYDSRAGLTSHDEAMFSNLTYGNPSNLQGIKEIDDDASSGIYESLDDPLDEDFQPYTVEAASIVTGNEGDSTADQIHLDFTQENIGNDLNNPTYMVGFSKSPDDEGAIKLDNPTYISNLNVGDTSNYESES